MCACVTVKLAAAFFTAKTQTIKIGQSNKGSINFSL